MLSNQTILRVPSAVKTLCRLAGVATLAMGASFASHAVGGEALDIELPSMRTPIDAVQAARPTAEYSASVATGAQDESEAAQPLTRARVRESLAMARLANLVNPGGEQGDTPEVLQAREDFNALQTEVMEAEYRTAALLLQQQQTAELLAQAQGYAQESPTADQQIVEVVVVPSNKVYEALVESGPTETAMGNEDAPAAAPQGVLLLLVDDRITD